MRQDIRAEAPERQTEQAPAWPVESARPGEHHQATQHRENRHHQPGPVEQFQVIWQVQQGEHLPESGLRLARPRTRFVKRRRDRMGCDDRQGRHQFDQRRVVVIELERPLLPVAHPRRQVRDLVHRRVLLQEAVDRQGRVQGEQQYDHQRDLRPGPERPLVSAPRARATSGGLGWFGTSLGTSRLFEEPTTRQGTLRSGRKSHRDVRVVFALRLDRLSYHRPRTSATSGGITAIGQVEDESETSQSSVVSILSADWMYSVRGSEMEGHVLPSPSN